MPGSSIPLSAAVPSPPTTSSPVPTISSEVSAPEGYDLAEEPLEVEVENRDVTVEFVNSGDGVVTTPTKPVPDTGR